MQGFEMNQQHLIATVLFSLIIGANTFSYKEAKHWKNQYSGCNGRNQSPISIDSSSSTSIPQGFSSIDKKLKLTDFHKVPTKMTATNTGHTVEIKADWSGKPPRFTGGPFRRSYVFEKATFHWAPKKLADQLEQNEMEMHMYFYKTDYKSFDKAQSQKDGLAIFNVLLVVGEVETGFSLENLEENLKNVQSINSTSEIPPIPITSAVADTVPMFVFYKGSLDYPPCSETVTWFMYDSNVEITANLLKEFRKIKLAEGDVANLRPVQARNNRELKLVYTI